MDAKHFTEPELEFGRGGKHIDVRFGIVDHGPLDVDSEIAPKPVRVGLVGTRETIAEVQGWLKKASAPIAAKESRHKTLFPEFPGFNDESCFQTSLQFHERWIAEISKQQIEALANTTDDVDLTESAVDLFLQAAKEILVPNGPQVLICAPPASLMDSLEGARNRMRSSEDDELDDSHDASLPVKWTVPPAFHDLLKAKGMTLNIPIQFVRQPTYTGKREKRSPLGKKAMLHPLQDEATRAWNFHTALYYKAGGNLWRILRKSSELTTCYIGVSFYKSLDGERIHTSIAQVFNERGEGIIVKGALAKVDKNDRQAHLSKEDANLLLKSAIKAYRVEHKTMPARVVIHKTSKSNEDELEGFVTAIREERIASVDIVWIRRSSIRLYREGVYPPLRGTFMQIDSKSGILYLRGSVNFYHAWPGMYVPRPLEITVQESETPIEQIAEEIMSLSKLNWNNTQFDGGEPITVKAARKVGDILKCIGADQPMQWNFRYYT